MGEVVTIKDAKGIKNVGQTGTIIGWSEKGTTVKVKFADGSQTSYATSHVLKGGQAQAEASVSSPSQPVPPPAKVGPVPPPNGPATDQLGQTVNYWSGKAGKYVVGHITGVIEKSPGKFYYQVNVGGNVYDVNPNSMQYGSVATATPAPSPAYSSSSSSQSSIPAEGKDQKVPVAASSGGFAPLKVFKDPGKQVPNAPPTWVQMWKNFLSNLPAKERAALRTWTGGEYSSMNHHLRGGKKAENHHTHADTIANIDKAMTKGALEQDLVLYRSGAFGDIVDIHALKPGDFVHDLGYTATAITTGAFGSGSILIRAPKGTKGIYVDSISQYGETKSKPEREFLLARGTRFVVIQNNPLILEIVQQDVYQKVH